MLLAAALPRPCLPSPVQVGWDTFLSNAVFWALVLAAKFAFDWFFVMKPMKLPILGLWHLGWLSTGGEGGGGVRLPGVTVVGVGWGGVGGATWAGSAAQRRWMAALACPPTHPPTPARPKPLPTPAGKVDGDFILCIARCLPGFIVMFNDAQVGAPRGPAGGTRSGAVGLAWASAEHRGQCVCVWGGDTGGCLQHPASGNISACTQRRLQAGDRGCPRWQHLQHPPLPVNLAIPPTPARPPPTY